MRGLVQRVSAASVSVVEDGTTTVVGEIEAGLCVLVGVTHTDDESHAAKLADKLWNLRIMDDGEGVMNLSIADTSRALLVISQFTLYGNTEKGRRPSWTAAAGGDHAEPLVDLVVENLRNLGATVATGRFGADMVVNITNVGPATLLIEL